METRIRYLVDDILESGGKEVAAHKLDKLGLFWMLELVVQGETESVEERLWHADGEAVIVSLRSFDHHHAGTVNLQVVSLV